ncbi:MAG TPA: hypothetical protein VK501_23700 [Baekduia sp.]|uniref:hypothetical protein n=1 Tax=Baekduia sp. TaxID=2600305 RepID=UPI002CA75FE8|nr:hypothetical protein [Baekduia sp.]HMJ36931.1 hypothetical protein [Baekduia sp.]
MLPRSLLLALSTALLAFVLTAPAWSVQPFSPACAGNWDCIGVDDPALGDDVVVLWRAHSATTQTVSLESRQRVGGGATVLTATTGPVTVEAGAMREFAARLPIVAGGVLAVAGATGPIEVEGVVESDDDGDGYGNRTQDACFNDFNRHDAPCGAVTTFGSALTFAPDPRGFSGSDVVQSATSAPRPAAASDGVITAYRVRSATTAPLTLQVLRPAGSGAFQAIAAAAPATPAAGGAVTTVTAVRLPVKAGDQLGLRAAGAVGAVAVAPSDLRTFVAPLDVGDTATPGAPSSHRLLAQADVEPDADADGFGDLTQDTCPFDAARHAGCQADLAVTSIFSSKDVNPGKDAFFEFWVTNHGPDPAKDVELRVTLPPGTVLGGNVAPCPSVAGVSTCRVPRLNPGDASAERFFVASAPGSTATSTATAGSATPDPDPTNNQLTWTATFHAPFTSPPWVAPVLRPCVNVVRGTRDDDVLRGTAFGDRLVGNDGDDLLKGNGAGDCLEGGAGNDVLDGGDGDDRLAGSAGKDRLTGGKGDDKLTGGRGNDRLSGGSGKDTISPGAGTDTVSAGPGNDTINTVDGVRETIDCGTGTDAIRADRRDRLKHCEKVTRR